jgi:hypothetical protein
MPFWVVKFSISAARGPLIDTVALASLPRLSGSVAVTLDASRTDAPSSG